MTKEKSWDDNHRDILLLTYEMSKKILQKTLGGLDKAYYLRQLFFGAIFGIIMIALFLQSPNEIPFYVFIYYVICIFLYPYSRFVYEGIVGFIVGENIFIANIITMLFVKFVTMSICFMFAPMIAIVGFLYLYFFHTKNNTFDDR